MLNYIFTKIEHLMFRCRVNWFATVYLCFRLLPWREARRLPILAYGRIDFQSLEGRVCFSSPTVRYGMVRIGPRWCRSQGVTRLCIDGTLVLGDDILIGRGTEIHVKRGATLTIGGGGGILEDCMVFCFCNITIGKAASITYHANIFDTDFHHMIDLVSKEIYSPAAPIHLGAYNWIGNNATIKKGTVTADNTTVAAAYSVLCKDYTCLGYPACPILGGSPARLLGSGKRRVRNYAHDDAVGEEMERKGISMMVYEGAIDELCNI